MNRVHQNRRGAALVLVLGLTAVLIAPLLAFLILVNQEGRHARQVRNSTSSSLLAEMALQESMAKLMEGHQMVAGPPGEVTGSLTAAPGLMEILSYDIPYNRGDERGSAAFVMPGENRPFFRDPFAASYSRKPANPRWIPLYSRRWFAPGTEQLGVGAAATRNPDYNPAVLFNINTPDNPFRVGEYYLSGLPVEPAFPRREKDSDGDFPDTGNAAQFSFRPGEPSPDRPIYVQWLPVLKDPTLPPGPENPMIGRYAYWIDVENTKIHAAASSRIWTEQPAFALVGDADSVAFGSGSHFSQRAGNPSRQRRRELESPLPGPDGLTRGGAAGPPLPGATGSSIRSLWLDWLNGNTPLAGDVSTIDWDYFEALRPFSSTNEGKDIGFGDLIRARAQAQESGEVPPLHQPEELFSLLDPAIREKGSPFARQVEAAYRRVVANQVTVYGFEDERDPLGRPKIDLVKFLVNHRQAAGAGGNPNLFKSSDLWSRLRNPDYHRVYDPGNHASQGRPISFTKSLNRFAGTGQSHRNANGEAAVLQMLVNMVEYTLPPDQPPLIDEASGLVGMKSMPYVAEVATRARSALWLLPEEDRDDLDVLLARDGSGNFTYQHEGKSLEYYTSHVLIEVALACMNPDPFATRPFNGSITLNYSWGTLPPGTDVTPGPQTLPLSGIYQTVSLSGEDKPKKFSVHGEAVVFQMGLVPAQVLWDKTYARALRISGWEIRDAGGQLWHKVPVRHPGAANPPSLWWTMAQPFRNTGLAKVNGTEVFFEDNTLARYQRDSDTHGFRAVGWFTVPDRKFDAEGNQLANHLEMMRWDEGFDPAMDDEQFTRLQNFIGSLRWRSAFESLYAIDPALGHRTGNLDARPEFDNTLRGHFYGMTGHVWRHGGSHGTEEEEIKDPPEEGESGEEDLPPPQDYSNLRVDKATEILRINAGVATQSSTQTFPSRQPQGIGRSALSLTVPILSATHDPGLEVEAVFSDDNPGGLLKNFRALNLDSFPLGERELKLKDDGKWLDDLAKAMNKVPSSGKPLKIHKNSHIETLELATIPEIKALEADKDQLHGKSLSGLFAGAPRGKMMTSIGEIGFVHSGMPNLPILLVEAHGTTPYMLNCPSSGPPMRMLLDLFTPGAFVDPQTGRRLSQSEWESGGGPSNSPSRPRVGTWNVNTAPAHEGYLTIREGAHGSSEEMKKEIDPQGMPAQVIWHPSAGGWRRNSFGNEHAFNKKVKDINKKIPGEPLDRLASPFASLPRGWNAWISIVGGDFSPSRAIGSGAWADSAAGYNTFTSGVFTWTAGRGIASSVPYYQTAFAEVGQDESLHSRLLTFGSDGRKELELKADGSVKKMNENDGMLRGRFTADEWLDFQRPTNSPLFPPRSFSPRFAVFPMRHHLSDIAIDYNYGAELRLFKTALNPRNNAHPPVTKSDGEIDEKLSDHNHFAGSHHAAGLFLNAPLVLMANQASTSANAFTIHIVAQSIKDTGKVRSGVPLSGVGHSDPDDVVLSERWSRVVLVRERPENDDDMEVQFHVLKREIR